MPKVKIIDLKIVLLLLSLFLVSHQAFSNGTHNSTRFFTPVSEMSRKDWSDPAEMERAWQAALVRIPDGKGKYIATTVYKLNDVCRCDYTVTGHIPGEVVALSPASGNNDRRRKSHRHEN